MEDTPRVYTFQERRKLNALVSTYRTIQDTWYFHKDLDYDSLEEQVDVPGWWFDWEPVVRECFPEVLVVMSGDRREERRFPVYVVVPRVGDWIELSSNPEQLAALAESLESPSSHGQVMMEVLDELRKMSHSLPSERVGEAMKHLNAFGRIIKPIA
jgi:Zn-finger domain-containing protein